MLQARSPLYTEQARKCPDKKVFDKHREAHLNRIQYQTRRTMLTKMRNIRRLRQEGDIKVSQAVRTFMKVLKSYLFFFLLETFKIR